jgi:hypothetical protein
LNAWWEWGLAGAALVAGWVGYGWRGTLIAVSVIVFWLLLQFSRTLRVLRIAARAPVGHVASAVTLNSRLGLGMRLADIIKLTGSLGQKVGDEPETFTWHDTGGLVVEVAFQSGRCHSWRLIRPTDRQ